MAFPAAGMRPGLKVMHIPLYRQLLTRLRSRRTMASLALLTLHGFAWSRVASIIEELNYEVGAADIDRILAWLAVVAASFVALVILVRRGRIPGLT